MTLYINKSDFLNCSQCSALDGRMSEKYRIYGYRTATYQAAADFSGGDKAEVTGDRTLNIEHGGKIIGTVSRKRKEILLDWGISILNGFPDKWTYKIGSRFSEDIAFAVSLVMINGSRYIRLEISDNEDPLECLGFFLAITDAICSIST
ncbi:MAG: hypothetical protein Q4E74_00070 [Ruminococcus sp.]|nr:hypothetical protein [Ruminococcus sp.]